MADSSVATVVEKPTLAQQLLGAVGSIRGSFESKVSEVEELKSEKNLLEIQMRDLQVVKNELFPFGLEYTYCEICGSFRLDPDSTGVTCGTPRCLAGMGQKIIELEMRCKQSYELEKEIIEIAQKMGIEIFEAQKGGGAPLQNSALSILSDISEEVDDIKSVIQQIKL